MRQSTILLALEDLRARSEQTAVTSVKELERLRNGILDMLNAVRAAAPLGQRTDKSKQAEPEISHCPHAPALLNAARKSTSDDEAQTIPYRLLDAFIIEGKEVTTNLQILERLYFEELKEREFNIKKTHASTYQWIFDEDGPFKQVKFMDWVKRGSNIYWISGKAGSGKSTLMKLISNHPQTRDALQDWADKEACLIASHFFWSGGVLLQKSQTGLLQSLLYQILRHHPALIKLVFPEEWHARYADPLNFNPRQLWSYEELSIAFKRLSEQKSLSFKICMFVDGLDEYQGEHRDIVSILQQAATSPNIKVCLSSRPWNVFQNAFGGSENKITLQDYTKNDIRDYVCGILYHDTQFTELAEKNVQQAHDLRDQITEKANGVFLWVFLVVRSLLSGLTD